MNPSKLAKRLPTTVEVLLLSTGIISTLFVFINLLNLPIQLALFASWFLAVGLGIKVGYSYNSIQQGMLKGIHNGMEAVLVVLAVGALMGSWIAGGIVPSIIYYGISMMNPALFLFAAFILCALTSLATGTSFGTVGTAGIAMMGIGSGFGIPLPLVAGAIICGAYLGDKLSPLSDTTVMTASLCKVELIDHIKSMLYVSVPAAALAALLFLLVGLFYVGEIVDSSNVQNAAHALQSQFTIGVHMLLPAALVIACLAMRLPSVPTISLGALLGAIWAIVFQDLPSITAINSLYIGNQLDSDVAFLNTLLNRGGIESMYSVVALILFALGLGGAMEKIGMLQVISNNFLAWADKPGKLGLSTILAGVFGNVFGGAAYVSLITASTITEKRYDQLAIDRRVLSRNVESGGTITTPMVPWSDGGVFMAATLGVSVMSYLPFLWYHFFVLLLAIVYGYMNIAIWKTKTPDSTQ